MFVVVSVFGIFGVIVTAQILIEEEELIKNFEKVHMRATN